MPISVHSLVLLIPAVIVAMLPMLVIRPWIVLPTMVVGGIFLIEIAGDSLSQRFLLLLFGRRLDVHNVGILALEDGLVSLFLP